MTDTVLFAQIRRLLPLPVLVLCLSHPLAGLAQESGTVTGGGAPLSGASVSIVNSLIGTTSNTQAGNFSLSVPAGEYVLRASFVGFGTEQAPITVVAGQTTSQ